MHVVGEEAEAGAIPEHNFDEVGLPTPEHEEMAREEILPQHALDQHRKSLMPLRMSIQPRARCTFTPQEAAS